MSHEKNVGGRPRQGITKKVSLTLTEDEWNKIESSGLNVAGFIKQLMHKPEPEPITVHAGKLPPLPPSVYPANNPDIFKAPRVPVDLSRKLASELFRIEVGGLKRDGVVYSEEDIILAEQFMVEFLFPRGAEFAQLAVLNQYVCPNTNKRFGSADKLVRALVPEALSWPETRRVRQRNSALSTERRAAPRYLDQL